MEQSSYVSLLQKQQGKAKLAKFYRRRRSEEELRSAASLIIVEKCRSHLVTLYIYAMHKFSIRYEWQEANLWGQTLWLLAALCYPKRSEFHWTLDRQRSNSYTFFLLLLFDRIDKHFGFGLEFWLNETYVCIEHTTYQGKETLLLKNVELNGIFGVK